MDDVSANIVQELGIVGDQETGAGLEVLDIVGQPLHGELRERGKEREEKKRVEKKSERGKRKRGKKESVREGTEKIGRDLT
jgi:hypothetical protein